MGGNGGKKIFKMEKRDSDSVGIENSDRKKGKITFEREGGKEKKRKEKIGILKFETVSKKKQFLEVLNFETDTTKFTTKTVYATAAKTVLKSILVHTS